MCIPKRPVVFLLVLLGGGLLQVGQAQPKPTADLTAVSVGGGDLLTIGGLLQTDAYLNRSDGDGFRARSTRLRFGGQAKDLQYVVQTEFSSPSVLLDAFIRLPLTEQLRLTTGLFKTPFSAEILTGRPNLLLAERARVVNAIAPGRQVGATLTGGLASDRLSVVAGAFNGSPGLNTRGDNLLYTGRVSGRVPVGTGRLELGTNVAYKIESDLNFAGRSNFAGRRLLYGADATFTLDRWLVAGEVDGAQLDPNGGANTTFPFGFYVTAGADVVENHQVLVRFDRYDPDLPGRDAPSDQVGIGYNYEPTSLLRMLVNYQAATDDLGDGFLTARIQVALR